MKHSKNIKIRTRRTVMNGHKVVIEVYQKTNGKKITTLRKPRSKKSHIVKSTKAGRWATIIWTGDSIQYKN